MYVPNIKSLIYDVKKRIEDVDEENFRIALKYQFLTATEKAQVCGKYRPLGNDAKKVPIPYFEKQMDFVIFKILPNRNKEKNRYSILPLSDEFDPWVNEVYSYFQKFKDTPPFEFHSEISTSEKYFMTKVKKVFRGLSWPFTPYQTKQTGKVEARPKPFTSDPLRKLRLNDLILNFNFNPIDLYLFCLHNDNSRLFKNQINEILIENFDNYSESELIFRSSEYLNKFLKKNTDEDIEVNFLNTTHLYFLLWNYDKYSGDNLHFTDEIITELSNVVNMSNSEILSLLQQISFYDPKIDNFKPINSVDHGIKKIYEMCNWYWNNIENARKLFSEFEYNLDFIPSHYVNPFVDSLIPEKSNNFIEEGSIKYSTLKLRQRSNLLVKTARKYFIKQDPEGKLRCEICGYIKPDYVNQEIIHIHHLEPLKDINPSGIELNISEALSKIIPLCPTCHSLVHCKENKNLSIKEIIKRINQ